MLTQKQRHIKRFFDILFSFLGVLVLTLPILLLILLASLSTKSSGLFIQERIGQHGQPFQILKIRSMFNHDTNNHHITTLNDSRITKFGQLLRKYHLDELPQIYNVLVGQMSFVGPRPDVKGYADELMGADRIILTIKPGITGPATLAFRNEAELLSQQDHPKQYNDQVLWKKKVQLNKDYINNWSLLNDVKYIIKTIW